MHIYCFLEKNTIQKCPLFPIFKRSSSIHKNKPVLVASIVLKKSTSTVFVRFLKSTFNFTRFCAFAQKAKFYALKMLKKQNLTHPKATKLATLQNLDFLHCTSSPALYRLLYTGRLQKHTLPVLTLLYFPYLKQWHIFIGSLISILIFKRKLVIINISMRNLI